MSPAIIGGLLIIGGSIFMYRGEVFRASIFFLLADIAWIFLGIQSGDWIGTGLIIVGAILGLGTFIKMHSGKLKKTLHIN